MILMKLLLLVNIIMRKFLKLKDFDFVVVNKMKESGYYSYFLNNKQFEIFFYYDYFKGWRAGVANKWQEVLTECPECDKESALKKAQKLYRDLLVSM